MKKIYISAIMFMVAMSSCSQDETLYDGSASDAEGIFEIGVISGLTKGADVTTATLEGSTSGVKLHIDDSGSTSGAYDFTATGSDWNQTTTDLKWSDITFPANFYSLHDGEESKSLTMGTGSTAFDHSVPAGASSTHKDLVYHASTLDAIPTGGVLWVYHKHALSKINLYASVGDTKLYVASVNLVNVDSDGSMTVTPITASSPVGSTDLAWDNGTGSDINNATYEYYYVGDANSPTALATTEPKILITDNAAAPLMIIPQSTTAATATQIETANGTITGTYVQVIYYLTSENDLPVVGYSAVSKRSDADKYIASDQTKTLYVMAAFPLGYCFAGNKQYDVKLGIGGDNTTGGLLVYDYYVDKKGNKVTLTLDDGNSTPSTPDVPGLEPGDEILGKSTDDFDIIVTVENWSPSTDMELN